MSEADTHLARFYRDDRLIQVTAILSLTIALASPSVVHLALLKRAMQFSRVSSIDVIARSISTAASIVLAIVGLGWWSLAVGAIVLTISTTVGSWWICRWLPGRPGRVSGTLSTFRFAVAVYSRFSISYFTRNTDNVLVGWRFNAQSLGYYKRAYDLFALSASQLVAGITIVAVSALSRVNKDAAQYRRYLLSALTVTAFVGMGLASVLTIAGRDLILLLLGPRWEPAGRIFTYFAPGVGAMMIYCTNGWIHLSIGTPNRSIRWGIIEFGVTCALFVLGLRWGPAGVAAAWTISFWVLMIPAIWYAGKPIGFGVGPIIFVLWRYVAASLIAAGLAAVIISGMSVLRIGGATGAGIRVIGKFFMVTVFYVGAIVLLHGGLEPLHRIARIARELRPSANVVKSSCDIAKDSD